MVYEADRPFVLERLAQHMAGEIRGRSEMEYRIRTADGEIRWLRNVLSPVVDESEQTERLTGIAEDVTAAKESEAMLGEMHAKLAAPGGAAHGRAVANGLQVRAQIAQRKRSRRSYRPARPASAACSRPTSSG